MCFYLPCFLYFYKNLSTFSMYSHDYQCKNKISWSLDLMEPHGITNDRFIFSTIAPNLVQYQELDLSGLGVTSVPPAAWETNDVMKLDLSKNSIEDLPNELSLCSSLQVSF